MKIRTGFVSNSSSSSFIISGGKLDKIAKSMLKTIISDFDDWKDREDDDEKQEMMAHIARLKRNMETAMDNPDVKSRKIGIALPSVNYYTYIFERDKTVYVDTSWNHSWDVDGRSGEEEVQKELSDKKFIDINNGNITIGFQEDDLGKVV